MTYQILSINVCKKASAQNRAEALNIMRFLGLVASQVLLFHLPENTALKKVLQKLLPKKVPGSQRHINTDFLATAELNVIIPTRSAKPQLKQFCIRDLAWAIGIIQII